MDTLMQPVAIWFELRTVYGGDQDLSHVDYILCNSLSVTLSSRQTALIQLERVISFRFR